VHDIVLLKQLGINLMIVHDREYKINLVLKMLGTDGKFVNDRLTDKNIIKIIKIALCGSVNKKNVQGSFLFRVKLFFPIQWIF
jgi:acetylglutamate kinase